MGSTHTSVGPSPGGTGTRSSGSRTTQRRQSVLTSCRTSSSTPPSPATRAVDTPAAITSANPPASATPVRSLEMCIGTPPAAWTAGFQGQSVVLPGGTRFGLGAPTLAGQVAFGQFDTGTEDGIGSLDLATGRMTRVVTWSSQVSGMGWMAVELPWVVWEQGNS